MVFRKEEPETREELEMATTLLHNDIHNKDLQGRDNMRGIEKRNTKGAAIRSRVRWKQVGDKYSSQFFQVVWKRNTNSIISELWTINGENLN